MAIALDHTSTSVAETAVSASWTHTVGSGANILIVMVGAGSTAGTTGPTVSSISFGSDTLTKLTNHNTNGNAEIWYKFNPTVQTASITVTMSASSTSGWGGGALSLSGVDTSSQANCFGTPVVDAGITGTPSATVTTTVANSWVVDSFSDDNATTFTVGGSQTKIYETVTTGGSNQGASYQATTTTGSYTMSWSGTSDNHSHIAVEVKPSTGGGGGSSFQFVQRRIINLPPRF